ncbi:hypothetical protein [Desulfocurvus sp. DL9XJH121]
MTSLTPRRVATGQGRLALVVVLAMGLGLVSGVFFTRGGAGRNAGPDWPAFTAAAADRIVLEGPDGAFTLEHAAGGWRVRSPMQVGAPLADAAKVVDVLEFLALNRPIRRLGGGVAPVDFTPRAAVTLEGWGRIEIGGDDGTGLGVYARVTGRGDGAGYVVLSRDYVDVLSRGPWEYLDLRLLTADPGKVELARLESMDEAWEVKRQGDGFALVRPERMAASRVRGETMSLWLHEACSLRAQGLASAPPEEGRVPDLALAMRLRGGGEQWLKFWRPPNGEGRWLARSSRQEAFFFLDRGPVEKLDKNAFSLVDRRLVTLDLGRVRRLVLSGGGRQLLAERRDGTWRGPEGIPLTGIDMRLWRLTDLQYEYGPVGELPASAQEAMRLGLLDAAGRDVLRLLFFVDPGLPPGRCWAARDGETLYYPVDNRLFKDLQGQLPPAREGASAQ